METKSSPGKSPNLEVATAIIAIALTIATLLLLASLHFLSPEFDPSFRMVSEYAFGHYGWVLSLMFAAWGVSFMGIGGGAPLAGKNPCRQSGLVVPGDSRPR